MIGGYLFTPKQVESIDNKLRDLYFNFRGPISQNNIVTIVDIDEKSLKEMGQWPWPRNKFAQILQNLSDAGAGVVGLDIVFAEPDNGSPAKVMRDLGIKNSNLPDYDQILAMTMAQTPTIAGFVFAMQNDGIKPSTPPNINGIFIEKNKAEGIEALKQPYRAIPNTPILQDNVYSSGYFNSLPDDDGMVRAIPMVMKYKNIIYPSLSFEMIRAVKHAKKVFIDYDVNGVQDIRIKDITIPTDNEGKLLINYRGPGKTFKYVSAVDIYNNHFNKADVEGKFILVGTSAAGLMDLRAMPFDSVYPGVEAHANAIDNIIKGDFISKPYWTIGVDLIVIILVTFILSIVLVFTSAWASIFILFITLGAVNYSLYYMLFTKGIAYNIIFPNQSVIFSFIILMATNYLLESRQKDLVKKKFAAKVSPAVMEDLLKNCSQDVFAANQREITVSFSDVRNFTNISESLQDPKTLIQLMNAYMDPMTEIIIKTGGTVDKFIGDAIMSYWNAPADVENHPDRAVEATLMQIHYLRTLNAQIKVDPRFVNMVKMSEEMGVEPIDIGMGLNTGVAIVGEMGSTKRSDYTVIGDPINLGARLESLCKYYNSKCNISNFVKERLPENKYIYRFLDLVTVKGKKEPVEIWQIHDFITGYEGYYLFKSSKERLFEELEKYNHAIELYKGARFAEALEVFKEVNSWSDKSNKYIYNIYIERCEHYIAEPPVDFNGVFVHTTKG
jgi:adenylate cyclase